MKATDIDITAVTASQVARCHRIIDLNNNNLPFYLVESESDNLTEYKVQVIRKNGRWYFTCTCPAGLTGFKNCKAGVCKHVIWSQAAAAEYKEELKAQARHDAEKAERQHLYQVLNINYASSNVDNETLKRIAERNKKPAPTHYPTIQARPFSLFK